MSTHVLKTWPGAFRAVWERRKRFEIRKDDRGYAVGDILELREYSAEQERYTGKFVRVRVDYILRDCPQWGLSADYCVMSISFA